ncbi:hypothetical protein K2F45_20405 [Sphingobacterium siyangense]|uniref:hypothetical protein n=1 Tax=Sphingobacterium TaxID=28453 RepID=UPI00200FB1E0|nr:MULTISPECIES: hypothetical protein [Sphingobacterium]UQA74153.1 hypothetical protein K2F45_20405 [Sphingobacterium siyangense]
MIRNIPKIKTTSLLILTILTELTFAVLWYIEKQPTTWILFIGLTFGVVAIVAQCLNLIFIMIFAAKKPEVGYKENDRNKKYEFIRGLY